jgi:hypothetical protein
MESELILQTEKINKKVLNDLLKNNNDNPNTSIIGINIRNEMRPEFYH